MQWKPDPAGRDWVDKVTKVLELIVPQKWYQGLLRSIWGENYGKIDIAYEELSTGKEPAFNKNTAFNKDFGTTTGTVADGKKAEDNKNRSLNNKEQIENLAKLAYLGSVYFEGFSPGLTKSSVPIPLHLRGKLNIVAFGTSDNVGLAGDPSYITNLDYGAEVSDDGTKVNVVLGKEPLLNNGRRVRVFIHYTDI